MKNKLIILAILFILIITFTACSFNKEVNSYVDLVRFGTTTSWQYIKYNDNDIDTKIVWKEIQEEFLKIENLISPTIFDSDIYKFNNLNFGTIQIDKITYDLLKTSKEYYLKTEGAFNPATFILTDLWGFSERFREKDYAPIKDYDRQNPKEELPLNEYVEAFKNLLDFSKVKIFDKDGEYFVEKPNDFVEVNGKKYYMQIGLGGMAKGYAVDKAIQIIKKANIDIGYVSCGTSSIVCLKKDKKETFKVAFKNPRGDGTYMYVEGNDFALSTSGDYENYYIINNKRYSHIMNPFTAYPIDNNIMSASIVTNSAMLADIISTAVCVKGIELADKLSEEFDIAITFFEDEKKYVYTTKDIFKITDGEYKKYESK